MGGFTGFPRDGLAFFAELEANNERTWWLANKNRFETTVRDPMRAMLDELEPTFGIFRVFRMNRDTRFSKDKSPYKTAHAAMAETEGGSLHYVQFGSGGLFIGAGIYHPARDQLRRFRDAVADDLTGPALEQAIDAVRGRGLDVVGGGETPLTTAPKGFAKDHRRVELLRWKGCIAAKELGTPAWLDTGRAAGEVAKAWQAAAPVVSWLDANVGASELPPPV